MKDASRYFTDEEKARIEEAVREAERKTSAEVVPALATASGRYDRAEDIFGLVLGLVALSVCWLSFQEVTPASWSGRPVMSLGLGAVLGIVLAGFVVGAIVAGNVGWLRALFTSRSEMRDETLARARQVFASHKVYATEGGTGVLIYVSLFERMAAVIAEEAVVEQIGREALDGVRDTLVEGLRRGDACEAFRAAIRQAADLLAPALPRQDDDVNELPDPLVIVQAP